MTDALIELLSTYKYPVIRQGSLAPDAPYPDIFITFWNRDESGHSYYDNDTANVVYQFDVNCYGKNPTTVYDTIDSIRTLLKSNGWIIVSRAYDVASDEISHIGRGIEVEYLKTEN